ncbi:MAG: response regulator transcription factor [Candidatus Sumerlaeia bacterium]|nr:response regulator transcription factor [Candidatus Sumerlaeia bacterium]
MRVLVVEDEAKIAGALCAALGAEGHEAARVGDGPAAVAAVERGGVDLMVLDLGLPGFDGLEVLRRARAGGWRGPVLVLTARDAVDDRVAGLDAGADDYLVKPFAVAEVLARVRALARRGAAEASRLVVADLELDIVERRARRAGRLLDLTPKEFEVLLLLARHAGQPVTRRMLAEAVWNDVPRATPLDNVIDVHVARLRRKVDDPFAVRLIRTVRGVGFVLESAGCA